MSEPGGQSQIFYYLTAISHFLLWTVFKPTTLSVTYLVKYFREAYTIQLNGPFILVQGASLRLRGFTSKAN